MAESRLPELIALAKEPSSERRRELLRRITDVFVSQDDPVQSAELKLYDEVMGQLACDLEENVRAELATRLAPVSAPPTRLITNLAHDPSIAVAGPVLTHSPALSDEVLIDVARTRGQEHLRAISVRPTVSEAVTDTIVERGDDQTLGVLLRNDGARLSREGHETAVRRASVNPDLHEAVVGRKSLPADLLNEMYFVVEARLRTQILQRNGDIDPATLDRALENSRTKVATKVGGLPPDYDAIRLEVDELRQQNRITPSVLAGFLRNRETTRFLVALCSLAEVDFQTAQGILDRRELDALAIVCRAAGLDRPLFLTFVVLLMEKSGGGMAKARQYGELYDGLSLETAQRTLRFWNLRRQTEAGAEAAA